MDLFAIQLLGRSMHLAKESLARCNEDLADDAWNVTLFFEFDDLPRHWRAIRTTYGLYVEVQNGRLHQFFSNGRGEHVEETFEDLIFIGADSFAYIFRRARSLYNSDSYPSHSNAGGNSWKDFTRGYGREDMEALDQEFYAQHPVKSLPDFVADFIKLHSQDYVTQKA